jgi:hypothetical protein
MHIAYLHRLRRERLGGAEAMMEQNTRWRQLDLLELAASAIQRQRLDPVIRAELTGLLKLLINECSAAGAKTIRADDE